jgi:hypothetical protein
MEKLIALLVVFIPLAIYLILRAVGPGKRGCT